MAVNDNEESPQTRVLTEREKEEAREAYLALGIEHDPQLEIVELEVYDHPDDRGRPVVIPHLRVKEKE